VKRHGHLWGLVDIVIGSHVLSQTLGSAEDGTLGVQGSLQFVPCVDTLTISLDLTFFMTSQLLQVLITLQRWVYFGFIFILLYFFLLLFFFFLKWNSFGGAARTLLVVKLSLDTQEEWILCVSLEVKHLLLQKTILQSLGM